MAISPITCSRCEQALFELEPTSSLAAQNCSRCQGSPDSLNFRLADPDGVDDARRLQQFGEEGDFASAIPILRSEYRRP